MSCYNCKAKNNCMSAVQEGSVMCLVNKMRYGGTHGEEEPKIQQGWFCQYCGQPLKEMGMERYCNNPRCRNAYKSV